MKIMNVLKGEKLSNNLLNHSIDLWRRALLLCGRWKL